MAGEADSDGSGTVSVDELLDLLPDPPMSWQRKVIRQVLDCPSPEEMFCNLGATAQLRLGLDFRSLMEHYSIEVFRSELDSV